MRKLSSRSTRLWVGATIIAVGIALLGFRDAALAYQSRVAIAATPRPTPTTAPPQPPAGGASTRPPTVIGSPPPPPATQQLVRTPRPAGSMPPPLTAEDQEWLEITNATDVTVDPTAVSPTPAIGASQAVSIAAAHVGFEAANARILHGSIRSASGEARPAWVILFGGGELPTNGPPGPGGASAPPVARTLTGVAVDSATGKVLTWFMH